MGPAEAVVVLGAHPGAGASTVALGLAEVLARVGDRSVCLLDAASRDRSGLVSVTDIEPAGVPAGAAAEAWRVGRRRGLDVWRPRTSLARLLDLDGLPTCEESLAVVDAGWSLQEVMGSGNPVRVLMEASPLVLVGRASVPGVRRLEQALATVSEPVLVVAVGARRWPEVVRASHGPRLALSCAAGRVLLVPADRRLGLCGVDSSSLPKALLAALEPAAGLLAPQAADVRDRG